MTVDNHSLEHEQVVHFSDRTTGLRAIVAIHSTALGPALGGTRFYPYADEDAALSDVLLLSRAMAYKSACAGLDLGGGKAVIIGDPGRDKSEALLRAYGRFVESLGGRYLTACDVGTHPADMDVISKETRHVVGRSRDNSGCGDSSELTAYGVYQGMRAAVEHRWGSPSLAGRTVGVEGAGKVGRQLIELLVADGATVVVSDVSDSAIDYVRGQHPQVQAVPAGTLITSALDVFAPCALGNVLTKESVPGLRAAIVCGAANNQLADPAVGKLLQDKGVLYAPDYVVNAGGLIQACDERRGYDEERARSQAATIFDTTRQVLRDAEQDGILPTEAADRLSEQRLATGAGRFYLPGRP